MKIFFQNKKILLAILVIIILIAILVFALIMNSNVEGDVQTDSLSDSVQMTNTESDEIVRNFSEIDTPVSISEAPAGEIVWQSFQIDNEEFEVKNFETINSDGKEFQFKKIITFSEYEGLMNKSSQIRTLTKDDFINYFAVVILSNDINKSLQLEKAILSDDIYNLCLKYSDEMDSEFYYSGIVVIIPNDKDNYTLNPVITKSEINTDYDMAIENATEFLIEQNFSDFSKLNCSLTTINSDELTSSYTIVYSEDDYENQSEYFNVWIVNYIDLDNNENMQVIVDSDNGLILGYNI